MAGRGRRARADHLRAHLADRRARPGGQDRRGRQQPAHAAGAPAVPEQRLRAHRVDAGRAALVRRVPAVHARSSRRCGGCCWAPRSATARAIAVAWCVGIALAGYLWARKLFNRDPTPPVARRQRCSRSRSAASAAARSSSRPRPAYDDTASSYAGLSACSAAWRARAGGHGRLEVAQEPEPLGQRDHPHPRPVAQSVAGPAPRSRSTMASASRSAPQTGSSMRYGGGWRRGWSASSPAGAAGRRRSPDEVEPAVLGVGHHGDGLDLQCPRVQPGSVRRRRSGRRRVQQVDGAPPQAQAGLDVTAGEQDLGADAEAERERADRRRPPAAAPSAPASARPRRRRRAAGWRGPATTGARPRRTCPSRSITGSAAGRWRRASSPRSSCRHSSPIRAWAHRLQPRSCPLLEASSIRLAAFSAPSRSPAFSADVAGDAVGDAGHQRLVAVAQLAQGRAGLGRGPQHDRRRPGSGCPAGPAAAAAGRPATAPRGAPG